jgi:quercetin dioxygenase-like cupin family protein
VLSQPNTITKFLGRLDEEGEGPWVFYKEQKKGDVVPFHRHTANRTEFVIEGEIEWRERGKEPKIYGAGTLSYVEAGVLYGYEVLSEDAKILIIFDQAPGFNSN